MKSAGDSNASTTPVCSACRVPPPESASDWPPSALGISTQVGISGHTQAPAANVVCRLDRLLTGDAKAESPSESTSTPTESFASLNLLAMGPYKTFFHVIVVVNTGNGRETTPNCGCQLPRCPGRSAHVQRTELQRLAEVRRLKKLGSRTDAEVTRRSCAV